MEIGFEWCWRMEGGVGRWGMRLGGVGGGG